MDYNDCYQKAWGHSYNVQPLRAMRYYFVKKTLGKVINQFPVKKALDVGCGVGVIAKFILNFGRNIRVTGIDISSEAINLAKRNYPAVTFLVSDIESFETTKGYDLITAVDVIEHIKDDQFALRRMNLLLRDGGIIVLSLPHSMRYWTKSDEEGGHYRRYSKAEIVEKLGEAGFDLISLKSYGFPFPIPYLYLKNQLTEFRGSDEAVMIKNPKFITRMIASCLRYVFFLCEFDVGLGLHLLVVGQKLIKASQ